MTINDCERCGPGRFDPIEGKVVGGRDDYCAKCGKNLCARCMAKGCCGSAPAESGEAADGEVMGRKCEDCGMFFAVWGPAESETKCRKCRRKASGQLATK